MRRTAANIVVFGLGHLCENIKNPSSQTMYPWDERFRVATQVAAFFTSGSLFISYDKGYDPSAFTDCSESGTTLPPAGLHQPPALCKVYQIIAFITAMNMLYYSPEKSKMQEQISLSERFLYTGRFLPSDSCFACQCP